MAIKKRAPLGDVEREKAIEAFGDAAAGEGTQTAAVPSEPVAATPSAPISTETISLRMLLRFPDEELPRRLQDLAKQEDRSKHNMTLIALRAGLEALESQK